MKRCLLAIAVLVAVADATPAQAQFIGGPVTFRGGFGFNRGFGFSVQRSHFRAFGFAGGFTTRWVGIAPFAPVFPPIAHVTPFGFGPGFLGPGWGVGPRFGWNPVWGAAWGWNQPAFGWGWNPQPAFGWGWNQQPAWGWGGPPAFIPPAAFFGDNRDLANPLANPNGNAVAVAGGVLPKRANAALPPGPVVRPAEFLVIAPQKDRPLPLPGLNAPDIARAEPPVPAHVPPRPGFAFDPFARRELVNIEKVEVAPAEEAERLVKLGRDALAAGEYGTAGERFSRAIAADPTAANPHFLKAQALFASGDYADAVDAIRAGLAIEPAWPATAFDVKALYGANPATFAEQLAELRKVVAANPGRPTLEFLLGYQLWFSGEKLEAKKWFTPAARAFPGTVARFK